MLAGRLRYPFPPPLCYLPPTPSSSVKDHPGVRGVNYRSFDVIEHGPVEIDYSLS